MSTMKDYTDQDHETWRMLFSAQSVLRDSQITPEFSKGLSLLNMNPTAIPNLVEVNKKLLSLTGWQGVSVAGYAEPKIFFDMLASREFPIGQFIRNASNLAYTPEPDVFHDFYGHIPFFTLPAYANFCEEFGKRAMKYTDSYRIIDEFQRLFWFTIEFGMVKTPQGIKVLGAGIASSFKECAHALSDKPKLHKFDIEAIRNKKIRIDIVQDDLFLLESLDQLYTCLDEFEKPYKG